MRPEISNKILDIFDEAENRSRVHKTLLPDERIEASWGCGACEVAVFVAPSFYEESGTPICSECGEDMEYTGTWLLGDTGAL